MGASSPLGEWRTTGLEEKEIRNGDHGIGRIIQISKKRKMRRAKVK
jgi:hypothetical protein